MNKTFRIFYLTLFTILLALGWCMFPVCAVAQTPAPLHLAQRGEAVVFMLANSPPPYRADPTLDDYIADIRRMAPFGATVVIVDCNGWTTQYQGRFGLICQAARSLDVATIGVADFATFQLDEIGSFVAAIYAQPASCRAADGTPFMMTWGGSPALYKSLQSDLNLLAGEGEPVYAIANDQAAYAADTWIRGISSYDNGASAATLTARIQADAKLRRPGDLLFLGVSVYYNTAGEANPRTFGGNWAYAHSLWNAVLAAKPDLVEWATWNGVQEQTQIEPDPPAANPNGQKLTDRSALITVNSVPYMAAFKAGLASAPAQPVPGQ
jgi:hypothetical protein